VLEVLRTRRPLLVNDVDERTLATLAQDAEHLRLLRELGVASLMLVPLVARNRELGAIALVSADPARPFTGDDLVEAADLALRAALALDNVRLYREAHDANQAKTDLLAVISHDLRTPLNSIMGHAQLLGMGIPERLSDASLEHIERIRTSTAHLVYLIDQLLAYARLEAGHEELRVQEADGVSIAREVAAVVESLAAERGLDFELAGCDRAVPMVTDPDRLRQVLLNLVGNAIKYTQQGAVRLEVEGCGEGEVTFRVSDSGVGIRPEHLDRIFEPFWQVDPAQRGASGGTGLGLSVVQRVVRMLGGRIGVESEVGVGSRFTVRVPRGGGVNG
jgi:signal transduction histidine kinase